MTEPQNWCIDNFYIGKKIGSGQFGSVYLVKEKRNNFVLAIKMIRKNYIKENDLHNQLKREIEIHSHLLHPNILRLYGYFHDKERVYLMVELATKGELYEDIQKYGRYINERAATYMHQLALALKYCHERHVMHRDIKPENILIGSKGQCKLADFGWSVHYKTGVRNTMCGTLDYLAPEMVEQDSYTFEIDIWCLGVLLYEMLTKSVPFEDPSEQKTMERIKSVEFAVPDFVNPNAADMIKKILVMNPKARLSLDQIIQHPYIDEFSEKVTDDCQASRLMWAAGLNNLPDKENH
uniref:Aurora kinase n=1 Tax=Schmidtea mediterranea TaxID=79327 RepID=I1ZIC8_SCHMD|nr:aurora kinase-1 [Schmidtea mediterranea]